MVVIHWERYPHITETIHAHIWLQIQANLGLAPNTIEAYARALEEYLALCIRTKVAAISATKEHVSWYVHDLMTRPNPRGEKITTLDSGVGLANATLHQRLTAIRLWYDYLIEEGIRDANPVGRGRYTPGKIVYGKQERGLIPRLSKLPWIPDEEQWKGIIEAARQEPVRNRVMLALAYDAALRREELCSLLTSDIDPAQRLLTIRAETTKNRRARVVPYTEATAQLYINYLKERRVLSRARGPLFLSDSNRNRTQPITIWTWSKVIKGIAERSGVIQLSTHTFRHLRLTDLARSGWDIHEIATFAGHRSVESTLQYIHLSGGELAVKLERGMKSLHAWRVKMMAEELQ
ncbi:tyrosine-type recombinase/integrase [Ktedonobacter racemifer]|uniref:Integrase family protein n=1 Tax=Ktedonobacter racemifer DSM 44963 TaxID=485913 RepID=D6TUW5_KTERA|nr:tyrosine-type recombinase/integrase [Ktedonobacter racemifer]EFH85291.1 integrase family protein [Ktedonobacter racemifer DSM 44963]